MFWLSSSWALDATRTVIRTDDGVVPRPAVVPVVHAVVSRCAMEFRTLADTYAQLEETTRLQPTLEILVELFRKASPEEVDKITWLTQGKLHPDWLGIELGLAEKSLVPLVAEVAGVDVTEVQASLRRTGDLGTTAEMLLARRRRRGAPLSVIEVHQALDRAARISGSGSTARKAAVVMDLVRRATPREARYLLRIATGKLRLGVGDATLLHAIALAFDVPKPDLERAKNITSDLGLVARAAAQGDAIRRVRVTPGHPILPMLAQRLGDPEEILARFGGKAAAEYKYDGERVQIHRTPEGIELFSRRIERITHQYPDVVEWAARSVMAQKAIVDAEVVAIDPHTGRLRPFQVLMQRRRKYRVAEMMERIPVAVFAFDLLYLEGKDLLERGYLERRKALEQVVRTEPGFELARCRMVHNLEEFEEAFEEATGDGCEGLVLKDPRPESVYEAGTRSWHWIKFKREYRSELADTFDLVIVGGFYGRGRRAGTFGSLLLAAYDPETDTFPTVTRVGTGFSDTDLAALPRVLSPLQTQRRPSQIDARIEPDVWFRPEKVIEVLATEITLSPVHTAARDVVRKGAGLALRFPRFTGRWRDDKGPRDATTVGEILEMYHERSGRPHRPSSRSSGHERAR